MKLIRQTGILSWQDYHEQGEARVKRIVNQVNKQAREYAKLEGIKRLHWTADWQPHWANAFTDCPMSLLGPGAPKTDTPKRIFTHCDMAEYVVVVRDQDEVDADDIRFYEERADQLEREGEKRFLKQWAENVLKKAKAVLKCRKSREFKQEYMVDFIQSKEEMRLDRLGRLRQDGTHD